MPLHPKKRKRLISSTRPHRPSQRLNPETLSAKLSSNHTRNLIRQHHVLQKRLAAARHNHDQSLTSAVEAQIATSGGLARYQRASLAGQAKTRGGDSSVVLVQWLHEMMAEGRGDGRGRKEYEWRMLEVGALRVDNAAACSGLFTTVERIDLHAQEKGIVTQDFMERPLPAAEEEGFDLVSLSLVLNYVGDAGARGEMLKRVEGFLRKRKKKRGKGGDDDERGEDGGRKTNEQDGWFFPGLFFVLPAPCVTNSRYLDEERLEAMMQELGYVRAKRKLSLKLVYYFWRWVGEEEEEEKEKKSPNQKPTRRHEKREQDPSNNDDKPRRWAKKELRKGATRNNFAVVLKQENLSPPGT